MAKAPRQRVKEVTQQMVDAFREPLEDEEKVVYERTSREWQHEGDLGPRDILVSLYKKGWVGKTWKNLPGVDKGTWVYQRRHSID